MNWKVRIAALSLMLLAASGCQDKPSQDMSRLKQALRRHQARILFSRTAEEEPKTLVDLLTYLQSDDIPPQMWVAPYVMDPASDQRLPLQQCRQIQGPCLVAMHLCLPVEDRNADPEKLREIMVIMFRLNYPHSKELLSSIPSSR